MQHRHEDDIAPNERGEEVAIRIQLLLLLLLLLSTVSILRLDLILILVAKQQRSLFGLILLLESLEVALDKLYSWRHAEVLFSVYINVNGD